MRSFGFARSLIELVKCRRDGGDLALSDANGDEYVTSGLLTCGTCGARYRLDGGVIDTNRELQDLIEPMLQEREARDREAEEYDAYTEQPWYRLEVPSTMAELSDIDGKLVAEFGSGTGRFTTELIRAGGTVVAIDFSGASHRVLQKKLTGPSPLGLIREDVAHVRLKPGSFDVAVSAQLLQHIPTDEARQAFFKNAWSCLKPGGCFLLTAYFQEMRRRLRHLPQEGVHDSGIFFHHFTREELQRDLSPLFDIQILEPFLYHVPWIWRLDNVFPWISTLSGKTPLLREFGSLIMFKGTKKD